MAAEPYTGPTGIRLEGNSMHIDGYPDAVAVVRLSTKIAKRLADLRYHEGHLGFCEATMQQAGYENPERPLLHEAAILGIVLTFFSCFNDSKYVRPLSPKRVFARMPEAHEAFKYWQALRDKHFVHQQGTMAENITAIVLGQNAEVHDILSMKFAAHITSDNEHLQLLYNLINHSLKHVQEEIASALPKVFDEARSMQPHERAALEPLQITAPTTDKLRNG